MLINPKLTAVVTALILFGGTHAGREEFSLPQLRAIEQYIFSRDCGGLMDYLVVNPDIMAGTDPLAQELRSFVEGVGGGLIECLSAPETDVISGGSLNFNQIY